MLSAAAIAGGAAILNPMNASAIISAAMADEPSRDYTLSIPPMASPYPSKSSMASKSCTSSRRKSSTNSPRAQMHAHCWGYNSRTPGPTIEAVQGDRLRIYVTNRLPEPTTVHWHGLRIPNGMDGVNGLTQPAIATGQTFRYEFTLNDPGTFMYHPHFDEMTQQAMGMMGMFIVHPRQRPQFPVDRDYVILLSEWRIDPGRKPPRDRRKCSISTFSP